MYEYRGVDDPLTAGFPGGGWENGSSMTESSGYQNGIGPATFW